MKNDKALKNALSRGRDELPYGFDQRVMRRILLEADRRSRAAYRRSITMTALVSLLMLVGTGWILDHFMGFQLFQLFGRLQTASDPEGWFHPDAASLPMLYFYLYIAALVLLLLGLDHYLRKHFRKS